MRKIKHEEALEGEIVETRWDLKKIGIGLVVLVVLLIFGSYGLKFANNNFSANKSGGVLGAAEQSEVKNVPPLPSRQDIEGVISDARDTLSKITSDNLTSSQAAIQKIISDLQSLQGKSGAIGVVCNLLCKDK